MNRDLSFVHVLLREFKEEVKEHKEFWKDYSPDVWNDEESQMPEERYTEQEAYCWLYADTNFAFLTKKGVANTFKHPFDEKALPVYNDWFEQILDISIFPKYIIPKPEIEETVIQYLKRLADDIYRKRGCKVRYERSLRSFTGFLQKEFSSSEWGYFETIFPRKMEIRSCNNKGIIYSSRINLRIFCIRIV